MLAVTFAPMPVSAPGKGATPEGKLCISADSRMGDMNWYTHLEGMLGLEGGGLEADESSLKVITMIRRRTSVSVSFTMDSQQHGFFLSSITILASIEPAIGDECEMTRLSLRAEQCRIEGT